MRMWVFWTHVCAYICYVSCVPKVSGIWTYGKVAEAGQTQDDETEGGRCNNGKGAGVYRKKRCTKQERPKLSSALKNNLVKVSGLILNFACRWITLVFNRKAVQLMICMQLVWRGAHSALQLTLVGPKPWSLPQQVLIVLDCFPLTL